jgi:hypothetical protein
MKRRKKTKVKVAQPELPFVFSPEPSHLEVIDSDTGEIRFVPNPRYNK